MNAREFFNLVTTMRQVQKEYFEHRDQRSLRYCKVLEREVDNEIERVNSILNEQI